ncbi:MAG: hypothetical protein V4678_01515 [Patescibacteria group bacterium]
MHSHWRRFLPKRKFGGVVMPDGTRLTTVRSMDDASAFAEQVKTLPPREQRSDEAERLRTQLLAQTPKAVYAQAQMDTHKHGYHNREKRLYELIDFNDTLVSYVLATRHAELPGLADRLKKDMTDFCRRLNVPMFSDQQYDAIVRGLGREIAVYRTAKYGGFDVRMTSRTEDAFGIDMVIEQPDTKKVLNIDCKTPPSFRHRMEDLVHHGRITDDDLLRGDAAGFLTVMQHRGNESVPVTLFSILPDTLGEIHDFTFDEPEKLKVVLNTIFTSVE